MAPQVASNKWGKSHMGKHTSKQLERRYGDEINLNHIIKLQEKMAWDEKKHKEFCWVSSLNTWESQAKCEITVNFVSFPNGETFHKHAQSLFRLHISIV